MLSNATSDEISFCWPQCALVLVLVLVVVAVDVIGLRSPTTVKLTTRLGDKLSAAILAGGPYLSHLRRARYDSV